MTKRHKHADMIIAKAENMDLVVLVKGCKNGAWHETCQDGGNPRWWNDSQYFLCLPQHKEACLHWLNGGGVEFLNGLNEWRPVESLQVSIDMCSKKNIPFWHERMSFMSEDYKIRIKPRKEKRWIGVDPSNNQQSTKLFKSKQDLDSYFGGCAGNASGYQFIEIEVEV